eukprot:scaffold11358_cov90-Isochrysis_galbana.AAC.1
MRKGSFARLRRARHLELRSRPARRLAFGRWRSPQLRLVLVLRADFDDDGRPAVELVVAQATEHPGLWERLRSPLSPLARWESRGDPPRI